MLVPKDNDSMRFDRFLLHDLANGGRMIELSRIHGVGAVQESVSFAVDSEAGTYEAVLQPGMAPEDFADYYS